MKCPYCDREMRKGFIEQTKPLIPLTWMPDDRVVGFKALFLKQGIKLTADSDPYLTAYYCEDCKKFVINQEDIEK